MFRNIQTPEWPQEREERIPVKGVRKAIAAAMVTSAFTAPHVSVFTDVNATRTMEFVKRLKDSPDFAGVRVCPLLVMAKAIIWAVRRNPTVNSTLDRQRDHRPPLREPRHRGGDPPRAHRAERQGRAGAQPAATSRRRSSTSRSRRATARRSPPRWRTARSRSPTSARSAWTPARRSSTPARSAIVALGAIKQKPWVVDGEVRPAYVTTVGRELRSPRGGRGCREPVHRGHRLGHRRARAAARLSRQVRVY